MSINRTELIAALKELKVNTGSLACFGCGHEHNCGIHGCAIVNAALKAITEMTFVPMADRPPEKDGKYLCLWQERSIETGMFLNGHFRLYGENKDRLVSHWMPLPELPGCDGDG